MRLLDQPRVTARNGTTDKCTHICICNDGTGVCALPEHHTHDKKEAGDSGSRGSQLDYDELAVKLLRGPSFSLAPSQGQRAPPTLARASTPVT